MGIAIHTNSVVLQVVVSTMTSIRHRSSIVQEIAEYSLGNHAVSLNSEKLHY